MSFFVKRPPPENGQPEKTAVFPTPALNHEAVYFVKDTHFHDFPFILPVIIFISRINTAFPSSST